MQKCKYVFMYRQQNPARQQLNLQTKWYHFPLRAKIVFKALTTDLTRDPLQIVQP